MAGDPDGAMIRISHALCQFYRFHIIRLGLLLIIILAVSCALPAQTCSTGSDLDAATKTAIDNAATRYLQMSKNGDVAGLKANAIPQLAGDFGIDRAGRGYEQALSGGGQATIAGTYLLDASQAKAPLPRAEFYCGIYNSQDRQAFFIPNLPPGRYAIVIQKVNGKDPITLDTGAAKSWRRVEAGRILSAAGFRRRSRRRMVLGESARVQGEGILA